MPASAYDVARLAGVSQAAVSRAFTPGASISKKMLQRVQEAAQTLGYRPNMIARSLSMGRSDIVGVVLGIPEMSAHIATFKALSSKLTKAGKQIMIFTTDERDFVADVHVEDLLKYRIDALILISANMTAKIDEQCRQADIPMISVTRLTTMTDHLTGVTVDSAHAATKVAEHLVQQGYRRLAYMGGFTDSVTAREREAAFFAATVAQGLPAPYRFEGHYRRELAMEAARAIFAGPERPDAIFCGTDYIAMGTMDVARHEYGIAIGRELGIVGFDDAPQAAWPDRDLTSFTQPVAEMVDHVIDLLSGDAMAERPARIEVRGELVVRGSTRRG